MRERWMLYHVRAGKQLKKLICLSLALILAGCIPIGLKSSSLPFTSSIATAPVA